MYKKAAVIALGLMVALGFVGKAQADWILRAPEMIVTPPANVVIPIYATTDYNLGGWQWQMDFCEDGDSVKIVVDSITLTGHGVVTTWWDNNPGVMVSPAPYIEPNPPADYTVLIQEVGLILAGTVPPLNDEIIDVIWAHVEGTAPDTIELNLTQNAGCGGGWFFECLFADDTAGTHYADLQDGMIIFPEHELGISFSPAPPQAVDEGSSLMIVVTGTDSDNTHDIRVDVVGGYEPSFMDWHDGTVGTTPVVGTLFVNPGYCDDGVYTVTFMDTCYATGEFLTVDYEITVNNVNRPPFCVNVGPTDQTVSFGDTLETITVTFDDPDLTCQAPHTGDALTITYSIDPVPSTSPTFVDNGNGTATLDWIPDSLDIGDYTVVFTATDLGGLTAQCDTVKIHVVSVIPCDIPVPEGYSAADLYAFQIKKMCAYAGEEVLYPVYMSTPQHVDPSEDYVGAYEVLLAWDPSCMTLMDVIEAEIDSNFSEYFDYNIIPAGVVDVWPAVRVVAIRDKANNVYTPPIPPGCQFPIFYLKFNMNHDWDPNYACDVKFVVKECGDNTISSVDGLTLHTPAYLASVNPACDTTFDFSVAEACPDTNLIPKDVALLDGFHWVDGYVDCLADVDCPGGDISAYTLEYTTGDVNLNTVPYEVADAAFFHQYLLGYFTVDDDTLTDPQGWTGYDWQRAMMGSDVNHNTVPWEMGDLVLMTAVINGFIAPLSYTVPTEPVKLTVGGDNIYIDAPTDIGGVYLVIKYAGEIGEPVLGEYASGMTLDWNDLGGELRVVIWSLDHHVMPAGEGLLLTIPGLKPEYITKIDIADFAGNTLSVEKGLASFALRKAIPNPFKGTTEIGFAVASETNVNLSVYDVSGKLVRTLVNKKLVPGEYTATWDGKDNNGHSVKSGVYFVKMTAGKFSASRKLMLLK